MDTFSNAITDRPATAVFVEDSEGQANRLISDWLRAGEIESEREAQGADPRYSGAANSSHHDVNRRLFLTTLPRESGGTVGAYVERESWEGVVTGIDGRHLKVRLSDPLRKHDDEVAELTLDDITSFDRELVRIGATFHWTVGSWTSKIGGKSLISQIRFQRIPKWTLAGLRRAALQAETLESLFEWPSPTPTNSK